MTELKPKLFLETNAKVDLIVPRGGENLINFVKKHATCPVVVGK
jgi:glutamate-5-semialdehyde dehydrogenase